MRMYSLIIMSLSLMLYLLAILRKDDKGTKISSFVAFCLYLPVWIYLLTN